MTIITAKHSKKTNGEKGFNVRILNKIREYSNYKGTLWWNGVSLGGWYL